MSTTKQHAPEQFKATIEALERLVANPNDVNMIRYSDFALPCQVGRHVEGFTSHHAATAPTPWRQLKM